MCAESDIDGFIVLNTELMVCANWGGMFPVAANIGRAMLTFCISDRAKEMLLSNDGFIPHLISGLLLEPDHARKDKGYARNSVVQRDFAECIQQISLFPPGCEALKAAQGVMEALNALANAEGGKALTKEAKECALGALVQLTDRSKMDMNPDERSVDADSHLMMSCESNAI